MKRRKFIKSMAALGLSGSALSYIKNVNASGIIQDANFITPTRLPQIINVFLYGGASELAGNMTNIADINANSQNPYTANNSAGNDLLLLDDGNQPGQITQHGFWKNAGGDAMEDMLTGNGFAGESMLSVYRTIFRRKDNTRSHLQSIHSSLKGNLDIKNSGGVGTTIASVLYENKSQLDGSVALGGRQLSELVLPFVSFGGDAVDFSKDLSVNRVDLPLNMHAKSFDENFSNPYVRNNGVVGATDQAKIDAIVNKARAADNGRYEEIENAFKDSASLKSFTAFFAQAINDDSFMPFIGDINDPDRDPFTGRLIYPNGQFSQHIKSAVTLAMQNADTLYISVGGMGGWDDHDNAISKYESRMSDLMKTLRVAAKHLKYGTRLDFNGNPLPTDNIVINVHSDFGRNVNLNNSKGWDQGNNQNLYTIGGAALRPASALGKVIGTTERVGSTMQNRQFTQPINGSYEAEPMSIASTVYSYFGVQNPEILTADAVLNPAGDPKLDETLTGASALF